MTATLPLCQIDAFTDAVFGGNPAAVCPLHAWLDDGLMQAIAAENNLSETAFFVPATGGDADYDLRWFTPTDEVDLCGHATLASAYLVFERLKPETSSVRFATRSGILTVGRDGDNLVMDFPARPPEPAEMPAGLKHALGAEPTAFLRNVMNLAVLETADAVRGAQPDLGYIAAMEGDGLIVTAPGDGGTDFVSRYFAPHVGIPEDPVTGSAHCVLAPYWAERLGRSRLTAHQVSARGGRLTCEVAGERVRIAGRAALYLDGTIRV